MSDSTAWIALFRGINVGGNHILPMKELIVLLERLGCTDVQTYIQSGNAVFQHTESDAKKLAEMIEEVVSEKYGFRPRLLLVTQPEFEKIVAENPFSEASENPKTLHLFFLFEKSTSPKIDELNCLKLSNEEFKLRESVFYLHAPDGIGRSILAGKVEKLLGVNVTARNWNTVSAIYAIIRPSICKEIKTK